MAKHESDKEDLIADAIAMVDRAEFLLSGMGSEEPDCLVTAGFWRDRKLSLYFDQDPFYQFDQHGRLRRALENGLLFRSQGTTLARLTRDRSQQKTTLVRTDLNPEELAAFRERMLACVGRFLNGLVDQRSVMKRSVVTSASFVAELTAALRLIPGVGRDFLSRSVNQR